MKPAQTALAVAALFSAALATALPSTLETLDRRCLTGECNCSTAEFWWQEKACCLPVGGLPLPPQCPSDRSCPGEWYWHGIHNCCVPKHSNPPLPSCGNGPFSLWDTIDQCCKQPPKPNPPPSLPPPSLPPLPLPPLPLPPITPFPSCPSTHFFWQPNGCCLPHGGPPSIPSIPGDRGCPSNWWWHLEFNCCVPSFPNPPPIPVCNVGPFIVWDIFDKCCKQPNPTNPGNPPKPSSGIVTRTKRNHIEIAALRNRSPVCPSDLEECPINGTNETECVDPNEDLRHCGGCSAFGPEHGKDCAAISNVVGVTCIAAQKACQVTSCEDGFVPSHDSTSCVAAK